ncbi:PIN domain-containing protein [Roseivirga seohaensis]|uniref:PIN domain-containing protein n=1 Tax=Roseivirga seohaensis TaxID=1914963 RepID=UPI003BADBD71
MVYIIFDTNIWIYLANGYDPTSKTDSGSKHFEFLDTLKALRRDGKIEILINDIVIKEWKRNRHHVNQKIDKLKRKLADADKAVRDILKYAMSADDLSEKYKTGIEAEIQLNIDHIKNVEDFLTNECINTEISELIKLEIFDLAVNKEVPFHKGKNNIADIAILMSSYHYLVDHMEFDLPVYFVSNNWQDFTDGNDKNSFHPEIQNMLKNVDIKYERILPKAIELTKGIIIELDQYLAEKEYLNTIYFQCLEPLCHSSDSFQPYGYLDSELNVFYRSIVNRIPNQLELFEYTPPSELIHKKTKAGECVVCHTVHVHCPECSELCYLNWDDSQIRCFECDTSMELSNEFDDLSIIVNNLTNDDQLFEITL